MEKIREFIKDITPEWTQYEITKLYDNIVKVTTLEEALVNKTKNFYILGGVRNDLVYSIGIRAKDADIVKKCYFLIDLDIRKAYEEKYNDKVSNEDIQNNILDLLENIEDEYFKEWSYVVFTGNWIHIYYIWNPIEINPKDYSMWVERIYKKWNTLLWDEIYNADMACKNIARISRLPWTINQKNWAEVKIIANKKCNSRLFNLLPYFAEVTKQEKEQENLIKQKQYEEKMKDIKQWSNELYETIISIPAWQIAQMLMPQFPFDWKKNFKKWHSLKWYYYVEETNTICNWWSHEFAFWDSNSCWDSFQLVKRHKNFTSKETFDFYKKLLNIN